MLWKGRDAFAISSADRRYIKLFFLFFPLLLFNLQLPYRLVFVFKNHGFLNQ
jgi:hypothetical protein